MYHNDFKDSVERGGNNDDFDKLWKKLNNDIEKILNSHKKDKRNSCGYLIPIRLFKHPN